MSGSMRGRRTAGNTTTPLAMLLLILVGVGAWNYHRNHQLEQKSERGRAYSAYSTREVELLRDAVAGELEAARARLERAKRGRIDRASRASGAIQDAASTVAENESLKSVLDQELALRSGSGTGTALHLRRLTSF